MLFRGVTGFSGGNTESEPLISRPRNNWNISNESEGMYISVLENYLSLVVRDNNGL